MMVPDFQIERWCHNMGMIDPFDRELIQPASIDMRLGEHFRVMDPHNEVCIDLNDIKDISKYVHAPDAFTIHPGQFVLGATYEKVRIPRELAARVEGKSSLGRLGLMVHVTAGFIDPGFHGNITLEFRNLLPIPIILRPGRAICQLSFIEMTTGPMKPYNGRYQGDEGAVASRYGKEVNPDGGLL